MRLSWKARWEVYSQQTCVRSIRFSCSERLSILRRIALPKSRSDTKLLKLAMSGQFILASAPIRHIDASLEVIGGAFTPTDGRADGGGITREISRARERARTS